jgi:hypothetical protein
LFESSVKHHQTNKQTKQNPFLGNISVRTPEFRSKVKYLRLVRCNPLIHKHVIIAYERINFYAD